MALLTDSALLCSGRRTVNPNVPEGLVRTTYVLCESCMERYTAQHVTTLRRNSNQSVGATRPPPPPPESPLTADLLTPSAGEQDGTAPGREGPTGEQDGTTPGEGGTHR